MRDLYNIMLITNHVNMNINEWYLMSNIPEQPSPITNSTLYNNIPMSFVNLLLLLSIIYMTYIMTRGHLKNYMYRHHIVWGDHHFEHTTMKQFDESDSITFISFINKSTRKKYKRVKCNWFMCDNVYESHYTSIVFIYV